MFCGSRSVVAFARMMVLWGVVFNTLVSVLALKRATAARTGSAESSSEVILASGV